jgi:uncharacterized membrane protein YqaE (UPF0057 family)
VGKVSFRATGAQARWLGKKRVTSRRKYARAGKAELQCAKRNLAIEWLASLPGCDQAKSMFLWALDRSAGTWQICLNWARSAAIQHPSDFFLFHPQSPSLPVYKTNLITNISDTTAEDTVPKTRHHAFHRKVSLQLRGRAALHLLSCRFQRHPQPPCKSEYPAHPRCSFEAAANRLSSDIIKIIFAVLIPPLGVFLERGCNADFLINILLTILGYIPGKSCSLQPAHWIRPG